MPEPPGQWGNGPNASLPQEKCDFLPLLCRTPRAPARGARAAPEPRRTPGPALGLARRPEVNKRRSNLAGRQGLHVPGSCEAPRDGAGLGRARVHGRTYTQARRIRRVSSPRVAVLSDSQTQQAGAQGREGQTRGGAATAHPGVSLCTVPGALSVSAVFKTPALQHSQRADSERRRGRCGPTSRSPAPWPAAEREHTGPASASSPRAPPRGRGPPRWGLCSPRRPHRGHHASRRGPAPLPQEILGSPGRGRWRP